MIYAVYATHCFLQRLWVSHIANSMLNRPCVIAQQIKLGLGSPENAYVCASLKELADQGRPNETCGARYQLLHDGNAAYPAKLIRRAPHDVPWYGLVSVNWPPMRSRS